MSLRCLGPAGGRPGRLGNEDTRMLSPGPKLAGSSLAAAVAAGPHLCGSRCRSSLDRARGSRSRPSRSLVLVPWGPWLAAMAYYSAYYFAYYHACYILFRILLDIFFILFCNSC